MEVNGLFSRSEEEKRNHLSCRKHGLAAVLRDPPRKQKMIQMQNFKPQMQRKNTVIKVT